MIRLGPAGSILAVGAHPDDIEIGAGGTIIRLARRHPAARFTFAVFTGTEERREEARRSVERLLGDRADIAMLAAEDGILPYADPAGAKSWFRSVAGEADLVLAPWAGDAHQDHRFVSELVWQTCRRSTILEYHIPKWESEPFAPNALIPLDDAEVEAKVAHLLEGFPSQHAKPWYREEVFRSELTAFGIQAGTDHAEGFVARKLVIT